MLRIGWTSVGIALQACHVLEIGCGCGLMGLVLASLGAHVALTDLPQTMVFLAILASAAFHDSQMTTVEWSYAQEGIHAALCDLRNHQPTCRRCCRGI